jgi:hypothetical protein
MPLSWQFLSVTGEEGADDGNETEKAGEGNGADRGREKDDGQEAEKDDEQKDGRPKVGDQEHKNGVQKNEENGFEPRDIGNTHEILHEFKIFKVREVLHAYEISGEVGASSPAGAPRY